MFKSNPIKIYAVFLVGIIIPAGLLSFFGFRSFQYEKILLTKRSTEQNEATIALMDRQIRDKIQDLTKSARSITSRSSFQNWNVSKLINELLSLRSIPPYQIEQAYLFNAQDQLVFPYLERGAVKYIDALDWGIYSGQIKEFEYLEFVAKDIPKALKGYQDLQKKPLQAPLQVSLLKSMAGCYFKLNDFENAENSYKKIIQQHEMVPDIVGHPAGIVAVQLLEKLYLTTHEWRKAMEITAAAYEKLLFQHWSLPLAKSDRLLDQFESSLKSTLKKVPENSATRKKVFDILRIRSELNSRKKEADLFLTSVKPWLFKRLRKEGKMETGAMFMLPLPPNQKKKVLIFQPVFDENGLERLGFMVLIVNRDPLRNEINDILIELEKTSRITIDWEGRSNHSNQPMKGTPQKILILTHTIDAIDPPLELRIYESISNEQKELWERRVRIMSGMIGLSLLVIIIGLFVMTYAVRREAEIAGLKTGFVANVSHELRTPLSTITYIAEKLKLSRVRSKEDAANLYEMLFDEARRLQNLIENTLDFSKMLQKKKKYHTHKIDLNEVVKTVFDRFETKARQHNSNVNLKLSEKPLPINADIDTLMQAILNLLDNALKYSGDSKEIMLHTSIVHDQALVSVEDHGIGITPAQQKRIFEKFYRAEDPLARRSAGGVGLGLSIVKEIMDVHKGSIEVKSELGKGSIFSLKFPLVKESVRS